MNNFIIPSPTLSFKPEIAHRFLSLFNYSIATLQLIPKQQSTQQRPQLPGKRIWNGTKGSSCVTFDPSNFLHEDFIPDLYSLQHQLFGVYFMVNEGDGIIHPPANTARSAKSVTALKALFIDTDNGDIKTIGSYLLKNSLTPHIIVQSSPSKFHVYLLIKDTANTQESLSKWKKIQEHFFNLDQGYDQSMADPAKLLRLPGFYHTKATPFLTDIVQDNSDLNHYSLDVIYDQLPLSQTFQVLEDIGMPTPEKSYAFPTSVILEGGRHQELISYVRHQSNFTSNRNDLISAALGHTIRFFSNYEEFLPNTARYNELLKVVDDVLAYDKAEKQKEALAQLPDQSPTNSVDPLSKHLSPDEVFKRFALPDSFYYECPGLIGEITKTLSQSARYAAPPIAFATTLAAIGTLKGRLLRTPMGNSPANYFLCFAPTGSGKNYPQEVLSATFKSLGISKLLSNKIRSENGIYRFLEDNDALGCLILDEAEVFFSMLQSSKTEGYLKACKTALLSLYSSTNKTFHSGYTGNRKEKPTILENPQLNLVGFGVPEMLQSAFNKSAIADGIMQRFIILTHIVNREKNPNAQPPVALNSHYKEWMKDIVLRAKLSTESDMLDMLDMEQELESLSETESDDSIKIKNQLKNKLKKLKESKPDIDKVTLKYSRGAQLAFDSFDAEMTKAINKENNRYSGLAGIYTRAAEQVDRLTAVIAPIDPDTAVPEETMEYIISLIRSRTGAMKVYCEENFKDVSAPQAQGMSVGEDMDALVKFIARYMKRSEAVCVSYRDILRNFKVRNTKALQELLELCIGMGSVIELKKDDVLFPQNAKMGRYFKIS